MKKFIGYSLLLAVLSFFMSNYDLNTVATDQVSANSDVEEYDVGGPHVSYPDEK